MPSVERGSLTAPHTSNPSPHPAAPASGAWDGNDIFVFSTLNHIKYLLANGDHGIIRTLDVPIYLSSASNGTLHALDREGKVRKIVVDVSECAFKLALYRNEFDRVIRIMKQAKLSGHAIIAYLQKKGFPQVTRRHRHCHHHTTTNPRPAPATSTSPGPSSSPSRRSPSTSSPTSRRASTSPSSAATSTSRCRRRTPSTRRRTGRSSAPRP